MEQNLKVKKSKLALKQALLILMEKKSFHKISIKELCEMANLDRSTFYANYGDINMLLLDVHNDVFLGMSKSIDRTFRISIETTYEEQVSSLFNIIKYLDNNKDIFMLLLSNNNENLFERHLTDYYMNLLVTKNASYTERYIFLYHSIGSFSLIYQWLLDESPCQPKELAELICKMSDSARKNNKI